MRDSFVEALENARPNLTGFGTSGTLRTVAQFVGDNDFADFPFGVIVLGGNLQAVTPLIQAGSFFHE